jgi:hypothetical protein
MYFELLLVMCNTCIVTGFFGLVYLQFNIYLWQIPLYDPAVTTRLDSFACPTNALSFEPFYSTARRRQYVSIFHRRPVYYTCLGKVQSTLCYEF